jgi:hypothetical protein
MVPEKNDKRWKGLITGEVSSINISSFSLKMKISSLNAQIKFGGMAMDDAVEELRNSCVKYEKIYAKDLEAIFTYQTI